MTQPLAPQLTIPGMEVDPYQGMTYREKSAMILDQYEDARDNDNVHLLRCWWEFDGLHKVIDAETYRKLLAWIGHEQTTASETYRRRRQEIQQNSSPRRGYLRPSEKVEHYRRNRDGRGAPRGRG